MSEKAYFQQPRNYLEAEVRICCVRDDSLDDAVQRLDRAVRDAFPVDFDSDIEIDAVASSGLAYDD